jgi:hypothetical protein
MRKMAVIAATTLIVAVALLIGIPGDWFGGSTEASAGPKPRTLVLALDGVAFRAAKLAQTQGAFADWADAKPLISPFPSMTNVAFTAMLTPFGEKPIGGYEVRHYNMEDNDLVGGVFNYKKNKYAWRDSFDIKKTTTGSKIGVYLRPQKTAWKTMDQVEDLVMTTEKEIVLVHVASTDVMSHFDGDEVVVPFLVALSDWLDLLVDRHREERERPLRIVIVSDHGNSDSKVRHAGGLVKRLEKAGFEVTRTLNDPNDVVFPTFGVVSFGVLYLRPELAEKAARAVADHPQVNAVAWKFATDHLRVIAGDDEAVIRWKDRRGRRSYAYESLMGDPLEYDGVVAEMAAEGLLDEDGYASDGAWFEKTALRRFPDGPRRLVDSLTGVYVVNAATVIFSLESDYAVGLATARVGARLRSLGPLTGTHGGLDDVSSHGVFLTNDPSIAPRVAMRADQVFGDWATMVDGEIVVRAEADEPCCGAYGYITSY